MENQNTNRRFLAVTDALASPASSGSPMLGRPLERQSIVGVGAGDPLSSLQAASNSKPKIGNSTLTNIPCSHWLAK